MFYLLSILMGRASLPAFINERLMPFVRHTRNIKADFIHFDFCFIADERVVRWTNAPGRFIPCISDNLLHAFSLTLALSACIAFANGSGITEGDHLWNGVPLIINLSISID